MTGARTSTLVDEGIGNGRTGRKPVEVFIPWKTIAGVQERGRLMSPLQKEPHGKDHPLGNVSVVERPMSQSRREVSTGRESSSKRLSMPNTRTSPTEIFSHNRGRRFEAFQHVHGGDKNQTTWSPPADYSAPSPKTVVEEDEDCGEDAMHTFQPPGRAQTQGESFFTNEPDDNTMPDNDVEEDSIAGGKEEAEDEADAEKVMHNLMYPMEVDRKKERRKERAWLEKEGEKRRKQGKPRNFLLVDERTGMPYGVGVGDWRKELMLLSQDLDPAIGNINK